MKSILPCCFFVMAAVFSFSACKSKKAPAPASSVADSLQTINENPYVGMDQSPMDMTWYPVNYPIEKMKGNDSLKLISRVIYSRPHKKNRVIFGDAPGSLCVDGKPWRLGANEATEIDFFENVNIAGKNIPKGTYIMYCIPHADRWTIILNNNLYTWGLHIKEADDIFRTDIPVSEQSPSLEDFTMQFQDSPTGADLIMAWDNVKASLPVTFSK
jgi:hypothetical protein